MNKLFAGFLALLLATEAQAQSGATVRQSGNVTSGHVPVWGSQGIILDGGTAVAGTATSFGVTNNGGPGLCVNSGPITAPYNQICLAATTNGGTKISSYAVGGASSPGLVFDINGTIQNFPVFTGPVTDNNTTCFNGTTGALKNCNYTNHGASIIAFGADPTGVADSTTAINNAIASLPNGACGSIYVPTGKYRINTRITVTLSGTPCAFSIYGDGQDASILFWPNATGGLRVNYSSPAHSTHVRDLTFTTGQNTGGGNGLELNQTSFLNAFEQTDIFRVTFRGDNSIGSIGSNRWDIAALVNGVSGTSWDTVTMYGSLNNSVGIQFQGVVASSGYSIYHNVSKSTFNNLSFGIVYGSFTQGVTISQSNFQNGVQGIFVGAGQTGVLSQLNVFDSQFAQTGDNIQINTAIGQVTIRGNDMFAANSASCVFLNATSGFNIIGNFCSPGTPNTAPNGFVINNTAASTLGTIANNQIIGINGTGIWLQNSSSRVSVFGNTFIGVGNNFVDTGTGNGGFEVRATGVFTNSQQNDISQVLVNGLNPGTEFNTWFSGNKATEGFVSGVLVPNGSSVFQVNAVAGYIKSNAAAVSTGGYVAGFFFAEANANNANMFGINPVCIVPSGGLTGVKCQNEFDFNINSANVTVTGISMQLSGASNPGTAVGYVVTRAAGSTQQWGTAFFSADDAVFQGAYFGASNSGNSQNSQTIQFGGRDAGGVLRKPIIFSDPNGALVLKNGQANQAIAFQDTTTGNIFTSTSSQTNVVPNTASTSSTTGALTSNGGIAAAGAIWAGTYVAIGPVAVASLPACAAGTEGARASVNNSNAASFTAGIGAVVAGGGTTHVPVYCDGTNWRIG